MPWVNTASIRRGRIYVAVNSGGSVSVRSPLHWLPWRFCFLQQKRWRFRKMRRESLQLTHEYLESQRRVAVEETMRRFAWKGDGIVAPEKIKRNSLPKSATLCDREK